MKAVAPFTGAWIEIMNLIELNDMYLHVAPFTGAWIEIASVYSLGASVSSRTLHGCVD